MKSYEIHPNAHLQDVASMIKIAVTCDSRLMLRRRMMQMQTLRTFLIFPLCCVFPDIFRKHRLPSHLPSSTTPKYARAYNCSISKALAASCSEGASGQCIVKLLQSQEQCPNIALDLPSLPFATWMLHVVTHATVIACNTFSAFSGGTRVSLNMSESCAHTNRYPQRKKNHNTHCTRCGKLATEKTTSRIIGKVPKKARVIVPHLRESCDLLSPCVARMHVFQNKAKASRHTNPLQHHAMAHM